MVQSLCYPGPVSSHMENTSADYPDNSAEKVGLKCFVTYTSNCRVTSVLMNLIAGAQLTQSHVHCTASLYSVSL